MIRYVLACGRGHTFEGWFRDGAGFVEQVESGQVGCPICGSVDIRKAPMAPSVAVREVSGEDRRKPGEAKSGSPEPKPDSPTDVDRVSAAIKALREHVEANATDVGRDFPDEARRIHYGETEPRSIYGHANLTETRALREEGIPCLPVPWGERRGH